MVIKKKNYALKAFKMLSLIKNYCSIFNSVEPTLQNHSCSSLCIKKYVSTANSKLKIMNHMI